MREDIRERIEMIKRGEAPEGYKKTKVGIIPERWKLEIFSDMTIIEGGLVDPKIEPYASMFHIGSENIERDTGRIQNVKKAVEQGRILLYIIQFSSNSYFPEISPCSTAFFTYIISVSHVFFLM